MKKSFYNTDFVAIYVEDNYNPGFNQFIKTHFDSLSKQLSEVNVLFVYLPLLQTNKHIRGILDYNRPLLNKVFDETSIGDMYAKLKSRLSTPFAGEGLLWAGLNHNSTYQGFELTSEKDIPSSFLQFAEYLKNQQPDEIVVDFTIQQSVFHFSYSEEVDYPSDLSFSIEDIDSDLSFSPEYIESDQSFSPEDVELAQEIKEKILKLQESGSLRLLNDILEEVLVSQPRLSTLFITDDYRFFLKDYEMREVKMSPLPKALYLLYLQHPNGILFKELSDYHDELLSIYKNLTTHEDPDKMMQSIRAMTDPLNNSVNEKCSRIRAAFLEVISDKLADNYYITGSRGEAKKIKLNRSLVAYQ